MGKLDWTTLESRILVQDEWLTLRADRCMTPGGAEIAPFYVLEYPDWVHIVAVDASQRLLMVRQFRQGIGRATWELPGGTVDAQDESPEAAARRELLEETGYGGGDLQPVVVLSPNPSSQTNLLHTFAMSEPERVAAPKEDPAEELEVAFMDLPTVMKLIRNGEFAQSLHVASLFLGLGKLDIPIPMG